MSTKKVWIKATLELSPRAYKALILRSKDEQSGIQLKIKDTEEHITVPITVETIYVQQTLFSNED